MLAPGADSINLNDKIMPLYLDTILPGITQPGDDANYGSSATQDVLALQVRSQAVHAQRHAFQRCCHTKRGLCKG